MLFPQTEKAEQHKIAATHGSTLHVDLYQHAVALVTGLQGYFESYIVSKYSQSSVVTVAVRKPSTKAFTAFSVLLRSLSRPRTFQVKSIALLLPVASQCLPFKNSHFNTALPTSRR